MTEQQKKTLGLAIASLICGLLFIFPLLGILFSLLAIILGIVALVKISNNKDTLKGKGLAIAGISLGAFGIIILPIVALLIAIAVPNLLRARVSANDALAKSTLRTLATASETYAAENEGAYPSSVYDLIHGDRPYIENTYCGEENAGFAYTCHFNDSSYTFIAEPVDPGASGTTTFTITTGGVMTPGY